MIGDLKKIKIFLSSFLAVILLSSCGEQQKNFENDVTKERIISLIDNQNYDSIIYWYESSNDQSKNKHSNLYAMAKLGRSGFDPINMIENILDKQKFKNRELETLFGDCENISYKKIESPQIKCLFVRLLNQLPSANHPDFIEGKAVLHSLAEQNKLSESDQTLLLVLETATVVDRVGSILESYLRVSDKISDEDLLNFYTEIELAAKSSREWIEQMEKSPKMISEKITGISKVSLLFKDKGKVKFAKETGIPYILENINPENKNARAVISRITFIQIIDSVLREHFGIYNENSEVLGEEN